MTTADHPPHGASPAGAEVGTRTLRTARGLAALGVGEIVGKLAALVLVVVAARALGPADFGVFAFALALGTLVAILPSWGFDTLLIQRGSVGHDQLPALLAELLTLRIALAAPVLVLLAAGELVQRGPGTAGWASVLVVFACLLDTFSDGFRSAATAREAQGRCAVVQIVQRVSGTGLVILAMITHGGLLGVSAGYTAGSVIGLLGMSVALRRLGITPAWRSVTRACVRDTLRRSHVLGAYAVVSMALLKINIVLLGLQAGDVAVGVYAAAYRLLETVLFIPWVVSRALYPVMTAAPDPDRIRRGVDRGVAVISALFLPYAVVLLLRGDQLLTLIYGNTFAVQGAPVLLWLAAAPLFFGLANIVGNALLAHGPNVRLLIGSSLALVVNLALVLTLVPVAGVVGASVATTVAYLVEAVSLGIFAHRQVNELVRARSQVSSVAAAAAAAIVLMVPLPLVPALLLAAASFALTWYVTATTFDVEQVLVVRRLLSRGRSAVS